MRGRHQAQHDPQETEPHLRAQPLLPAKQPVPGLCLPSDDGWGRGQAGDYHPRVPQVTLLLCLDAPVVVFAHSQS